MATINRLYFDTPDYTASYDYDDVQLKLLAYHVTNRMASNLTIGIFQSSDDSLLDTLAFPPGQTDQALHGAAQRSVTLNAQGKPTNLYAKTIS